MACKAGDGFGMYYAEWTDQAGTTHLWAVGSGETVCGHGVGLHTETPQREVCESCVHALTTSRSVTIFGSCTSAIIKGANE